MCVFCEAISRHVHLVENSHAVAFPDAYPLSPGHALIVPRRHVTDFFTLSGDEQAAVWDLIRQVRDSIEGEYSPAGYNVGLNAGPVAGQTINHAHVHVIPRYKGDVDDPRGGIRWVIPARAAYWDEL
jgi:diadenosine tetraphosphate (Ap4A) HIT family hydrolase